MKTQKIITVSLVLVLVLVATAFLSNKDQSSKEEIKQVILEGYIHGAFNELDPEAMSKTFHEDFAIFSAKGNDISRYEIKDWVNGVEKRKNDPEFDPENNQWDAEFSNIDVTGNSAAVKINLSHEGRLIYTDYLSLLKFDDGWRIVAKVYHKH
ncbi:MAG: nuclear transport factor 2 family protein [Bacteroidota bacterium]